MKRRLMHFKMSMGKSAKGVRKERKTGNCISIAVVVLLSLWMTAQVVSGKITTLGTLVQDRSFPTISYNTLSENVVGILLQDSSGSSILKNYFQNNTEPLRDDRRLKSFFQQNNLMAQSDFLKCNFFKSIFVTETFNGIEDFDASQLALSIVVGSDSLSQMFGSYRSLFKSDIDSIYFGIVSDTHFSSSLLEIVNINSNDNNLSLFFNKYSSYLFNLIKFVIPGFIKFEIFATFLSVQFG